MNRTIFIRSIMGGLICLVALPLCQAVARAAPRKSIPGRNHHTVVYDRQQNRMIVLAGWTVGSHLAGCWSLDLATFQWTEIPTPIKGWGHTALVDEPSNRMLVFGGNHSGKSNNAFWSLDLKTLKWKEIAVTGGTPPPRLYHRAILDTKQKRMMIFCGIAGYGKGRLSDLWRFNLRSPKWRELAPTGTDRARATPLLRFTIPSGTG